MNRGGFVEFTQAKERAQSGDSSGSRVDSNGGHVAASPTKKRRGRLKRWAKLQPKLEGMGRRIELDVATHLGVIETYADDEGARDLVATDHQVPEREVENLRDSPQGMDNADAVAPCRHAAFH